MTHDEPDQPGPQDAPFGADEIARARRAERALIASRDALEKTTAELRQEREWFAITLGSIGDGVISTDAAGDVSYINPVAQTMVGWTSAQALGRPLAEVFRIVNEDTGQPAHNPIVQVLAEGEIVALANHTTLIARDGRELAIEDSAAPIRNSDGQLVGAVMVFHDVTQRRRTERALRRSEERQRAVVEQAVVGIVVADLSAVIREANPAYCALLGYTIPELQQMTFLQLTHPQDLEATHVQVRRLLSGEIRQYTLEKRFLRKDGEAVWTNTTATLLHRDDGKVTEIHAVVQDITTRRQVQQMRSHLAAVVDSTDDSVITTTIDGLITSWNPGAERMYGYAAAEVLDQSVFLMIPEHLVEEEFSILARLRAGEKIENYSTVRRRKDGSFVDISLSVSPLRDSVGRVIGGSKIGRDTTIAKQAEDALREQNRILELLHLTGRSIASQLELQAIIQTVTDSATALAGAAFGAFFYNVTNAKGESFLLHALSGAPREAFARFGLPRKTPIFGPTFSGEHVVRSPDITRDSRYGTMAPHYGMPEGHPPVRSYLAVPVVSRSGEAIGGLFFGHPQPDVFSQRTEQLVVGVAAQAAIAIDNARLYEAAQREIQSRERAEASLREIDERKDRFLATLAHELRNPLAPIRQATLISKDARASDAQKRWSHDVITRQVQHMSLLLDDLLDISRVTRGKLELRPQLTSLAAVVDAAVETARPVIDAKQHDFALELPLESVEFAADPLRLAQVLSNLLTNAAKYTDPGGTIRLHGSADAQRIKISVIDDGVGLAKEALSQLFEMFSQVKSAQDRSEGGLGIGLALSRGLVELHGGSLTAESPGLGQGSRFTVRLPRSTLVAGNSTPEYGPAEPSRVQRRILLADDNRDAAESLALLLRLDEHDVTVVHDGKQALQTMHTRWPEVALLDIGMPELDGYEVARQIRRQPSGRAVVLVAITGWGQDADKDRALAAGFDHHFTKPVDADSLRKLLAALDGT